MDRADDKTSQRVEYYAHSANRGEDGVPEPLSMHLRAVAERASQFAETFGAEQQAFAAGLLHDLGKYGDRFQCRLQDPRQRAGDHWSAGAIVLANGLRRYGVLSAIAVAGHHVGLRQIPAGWQAILKDIQRDMLDRPDDFAEKDIQLLWKRWAADGFDLSQVASGLTVTECPASDMLDTRMLFSALVDADFLETEAHFEGDATAPRRPRPEGPSLDVRNAIDDLNGYLDGVRRKHSGSPLAHLRDKLFSRCVEAADRPRGVFSLSAPTGVGKTLAMLAFGLHHAARHGMQRLVVVMPFLNIIEQTAKIYRAIFSSQSDAHPHTVLEHHSLSEHGDSNTSHDDGREDDLPRLLTENWDAPIILTTSVQLLESLMAARSSKCRKLHRLARSVILFDEVQTIPVKLVVPTLATLSRLAESEGPFGSSVVFATATQPAFDCLEERVQELTATGWPAGEIVSDPQAMYDEAAGRVRVTWRHQSPVDLDDLAAELAEHDRVLCIVNLKRHAANLTAMLGKHGDDGLLHLSTNMCPAHRTAVLKKVNSRLDEGSPVRLIATQCVEAGVDLDFPVAYRALAPLEAIAQAAGRCNRHGMAEPGRVVVFKPADTRGIYPPGYKEAVQATECFLNGLAADQDLDSTEIINDPQRLRAYYRQFYSLSGRQSTATQRDDERPLIEAVRGGDFVEVAELYRLIDKKDTINVLVPYDQTAFDELVAEMAETQRRSAGIVRDWIRRATPHAVSLIRPTPEATLWNHLDPVQFSRHRPVDNGEASWFCTLSGLGYDSLTGISKESEETWIA